MKFSKKHAYIFAALLVVSYVGSTFNSLTVKLNNIDRTLAEIENNMQSRLDTFLSLVETTKESVIFESSTLEKITQYRSGIQNATGRNVAATYSEQLQKCVGSALPYFFFFAYVLSKFAYSM